MGSYYIPSNKLKGESRILFIFTTKSLIYTAAGAFIGLIFYAIFSLMGLKPVGIGCIAVLAIAGFTLGTFKFPSAGNTKMAKNVGGDSLDEVIVRYFQFKKRRKVYTYSIKRKEPDYTSMSNPLDMLGIKTGSNTKEESK